MLSLEIVSNIRLRFCLLETCAWTSTRWNSTKMKLSGLPLNRSHTPTPCLTKDTAQSTTAAGLRRAGNVKSSAWWTVLRKIWQARPVQRPIETLFFAQWPPGWERFQFKRIFQSGRWPFWRSHPPHNFQRNWKTKNSQCHLQPIVQPFQAHLKTTIAGLPGGLHFEVEYCYLVIVKLVQLYHFSWTIIRKTNFMIVKKRRTTIDTTRHSLNWKQTSWFRSPLSERWSS